MNRNLNSQEFSEDARQWGEGVQRDPESEQRLRTQMLMRAEEAPTLHRGFGSSRQFNPGSVLSLPMSSFSEDPAVAEEFSYGGSAGSFPTTLEVTGARGVPIHQDVSEDFSWQREWLSEGDIEIDDAVESVDPLLNVPSYKLRGHWRHFGM